MQITHDQHTTLQRTMDYNKSMTLEAMKKRALMGKATFVETKMESLKIENLITVIKQ